jgi:hypothetical protein
MKKTMLYLSLVSSLAVLPTVAMENEREVPGDPRGLSKDQQIAALQGRVDSMAAEITANEVVKEALRKELAEWDTRDQEGIRERILSPYQEQLLFRREEGKIGNKAWEALGGGNIALAGTLMGCIQGCPGKVVEIFYLGANNFTLLINGKVQDRAYKF